MNIAPAPGDKWVLSTASKLSLYLNGGFTAFFLGLYILYVILLRISRSKFIDIEGYAIGTGERGEGHIEAKGMAQGPGLGTSIRDIAANGLSLVGSEFTRLW